MTSTFFSRAEGSRQSATETASSLNFLSFLNRTIEKFVCKLGRNGSLKLLVEYYNLHTTKQKNKHRAELNFIGNYLFQQTDYRWPKVWVQSGCPFGSKINEQRISNECTFCHLFRGFVCECLFSLLRHVGAKTLIILTIQTVHTHVSTVMLSNASK